MTQTCSIDKTIDIPELKIEKMLQVVDIIQMAQRAKPTEFLTIKAGLDAEFGDDWRDFEASNFLPNKGQAVAKEIK
jgi:hypothetical protein